MGRFKRGLSLTFSSTKGSRFRGGHPRKSSCSGRSPLRSRSGAFFFPLHSAYLSCHGPWCRAVHYGWIKSYRANCWTWGDEPWRKAASGLDPFRFFMIRIFFFRFWPRCKHAMGGCLPEGGGGGRNGRRKKRAGSISKNHTTGLYRCVFPPEMSPSVDPPRAIDKCESNYFSNQNVNKKKISTKRARPRSARKQ